MRAFVLICFLFITGLMFGQIITVPFDEPTINEGVDAANDGDTVLVYPGTYYEHIYFNNKAITLASLYILTQDTSYIGQTIIDGDQSLAVVYYDEVDDTTAKLVGFTIKNAECGIECFRSSPYLAYLHVIDNYERGGIVLFQSNSTLDHIKINDNYSQQGGGIFAYIDNDFKIQDTEIKNNEASDEGGGIYCHLSTIEMSGVTISGNHANCGGGLHMTDVIQKFDTVNRSNVYYNYALSGNDFWYDPYEPCIGIVALDTFTVLHPSSYYALPLSYFEYDILAGKDELVASDLYVSPNGDDSNSGLTATEPLKTIRYANSIIRADSTSHHTIFLLYGIYSPGSNNEIFPVLFQDYNNLVGSSINDVVLDAQNTASVIHTFQNDNGYISNMTISGGSESGLYCYGSNCLIKNVIVSNNYGEWGGGISNRGGDLKLLNSEVVDNCAIRGGGLFSDYGDPVLTNSIFSNNHAESGGGIEFVFSLASLSGVSISNNKAEIYGGGIFLNQGLIKFDSTYRSNIFLNKAAVGNDIYSKYSLGNIKVWADTFTVLHPTDYHAALLDNFEFDILTAKLQQAEFDLYVSPEGDNNNSGATPDDPLMTIDHASCILRTTDINRRTIHLLEGLYSPFTNQEKFPICIPQFYNYCGENQDAVILNSEGAGRVIYIRNNTTSTLSGFTVTGGIDDFGAGIYMSDASPILCNISITGNTADRGAGIHMYKSDPLLQNLKIMDNHSAISAGGMILDRSNPEIINSVICRNYALNGGGGGIACYSSKPRFINVTIADNEAFGGGGMYLWGSDYTTGTSVSVTNSIIWGNQPDEVMMWSPAFEDTISIAYCDIKGGEEGINISNGGVVNWQEGNINYNPTFLETGDHPFALSFISPCIDRGTIDTNGLYLPPIDIIGNVRIWDGDQNGSAIIDMGAYEFGAPIWVGMYEFVAPTEKTDLITNVYPVPSDGLVNIEYILPEFSIVSIQILDCSGVILENSTSVKPKGMHMFTWNGAVYPGGIYYCIITQAGQSDMAPILLIK